MAHELHIIRTDVLLWALGGLGDAEPLSAEREPWQPLSPLQIATIRRLAAKAHCEWGELRDAAQRIGLTRNGWELYTLVP